jgi:hypothetical protein
MRLLSRQSATDAITKNIPKNISTKTKQDTIIIKNQNCFIYQLILAIVCTMVIDFKNFSQPFRLCPLSFCSFCHFLITLLRKWTLLDLGFYLFFCSPRLLFGDLGNYKTHTITSTVISYYVLFDSYIQPINIQF